jgi:DNA topoisomerase-2
MSSSSKTANTAAVLAKQYQKKTDKEHILDTPDTYIGSIESVHDCLWVYNSETNRIVSKEIQYIPGLYKLFDEGIVNSRDHVVRMIQKSLVQPIGTRLVTYIYVSIQEDGTIIMENDGDGIDIAKHPEYDIWIPQMIFGELRTSTNYNKDEERIVGGKNGFGFKLVLIWSTFGSIETVDATRGLKYYQEFHNNLSTMSEPVISKVKGAVKPYTRITFKPDYARLGIQGITPDTFALLQKRVYDICAVSDHSEKKINVRFNNMPLPVKNFQQYIDLYIGQKTENPRVYESNGERWEYAIALSPNHQYQQVSFVNGICTYKGGKHVDYIMGQIVRKLSDYIETKKKVKVNVSSIREQLFLFLRCDIVNPAFDSQSKDYMNTPSNKFGSHCSVSDGFIEKVAKMGVMNTACELTQVKENKAAARKTDGHQVKNLRGIQNFIDANYAGDGAKSADCTLILCEGLSALAGIVSGLSQKDRETIGIYPLRGKVLNVRGETRSKISDNKEITELKKILGLENGKEYNTMDDIRRNLRYGKIMIMCDQDTDGSHIKALCINLFHCEWRSLTQIPGFISFMNTPILRAKRANETLVFYNQGEYEQWKHIHENDQHLWKIKYFKGLGTSTSEEFKQYFANKKIVDFAPNGEISDDTIDKVFNGKRANDRKVWLENYNKDAFLDTSRTSVTYDEFIDNELIHFSNYDCARSIPSMVDGLKISLRKILYSAFKRNLRSEIKVAQFSGYVSEHSAYHHGEASLNGAIVNMAQTFVGSNNINLLMPCGQFGTRLQGGDDSASERYIFTMLNTITRAIFPSVDDAVLNYIDDDGTIVEPEYYAPIIPFALVNGIKGIGTGFSCNIPSYNPAELIEYIQHMLRTGEMTAPIELLPYYEGYEGLVEKIGDDKYLITGVYEKIGENKIIIRELPIGTWSMPYETFLEGLMDGGVDKQGNRIAPTLKDFKSLCSECNVHYEVEFPRGKLEELMDDVDEHGTDGVEKVLRLTTTIRTTNIHMFDENRKLKKYNTVYEVISDYYAVRMRIYEMRKAYQLAEMEKRLREISNRVRFIEMNLDGTIDMRRKTNQEVDTMLARHKFDKISKKDDTGDSDNNNASYNYLINMKMSSVTTENVAKLRKEHTDVIAEYEELKNMELAEMWNRELEALKTVYRGYKEWRVELQNAGRMDKKKVKQTGGTKSPLTPSLNTPSLKIKISNKRETKK